MPLFGLSVDNVNKMETKQDLEGLIKALDYKKNPFVRQRSAEALGKIGGSRAIDALIHALKDTDDNVQCTAVCALGKIDNPLAVGALINILREPKEILRQAALSALRTSHDSKAEAAVKSYESKILNKSDNGHSQSSALNGMPATSATEKKQTITQIKIAQEVVCASCKKSFTWGEAYHQDETPGSSLHNPPGHGNYRPRAFCPNCGFLVAEWEIDQVKDMDRWMWVGENATLNQGRELPPSPLGYWGHEIMTNFQVSLKEDCLNMKILRPIAKESTPQDKISSAQETKLVTAHPLWLCPHCGEPMKKNSLGIAIMPGDPLSKVAGFDTCSNCRSTFNQKEIYAGRFDTDSLISTKINEKFSVSMVVFNIKSIKAPSQSEIDLFCKKILKEKFPYSPIEHYYMVGFPDDISNEDAYTLYQSYVTRGRIPNLGRQFDWLKRTENQGNKIVALFFTKDKITEKIEDPKNKDVPTKIEESIRKEQLAKVEEADHKDDEYWRNTSIM